MEIHRRVTMCIGIMFINIISFLLSRSRNVKFDTVESLRNAEALAIFKGVKYIQKIYLLRSFKITHIMMDGYFKPLRSDISNLGIQVNTTTAGEPINGD